MLKHICGVCGYAYRYENNTSHGDSKLHMKFEDLPQTWVCPVCGAGKVRFKKEGQ